MNGTSIRNIKKNMAEASDYPRSSISAGKRPAIRQLDEYLKHRINALGLQRWINRGMPNEPFTRPINNRQRREATREARMVGHNRRYAESRRWTTGKTALRKQRRAA